MKNNRITSIILTIITVIFTVACDGLPEEQFVKYVIVTHNGFQDCVIDTTGKAEISVSVSGTSVLNQDVNVSLVKDSTILAQYNFDKYRNDKTLYYQALPDDCYDMGDGSLTIKSGSEYSILPINFDISKMDKYKQYVLPISISSTSAYEKGKDENAYVLLRILLANAYSGMYAMTGNVSEGVAGNLGVAMNRYLYMYDTNTCYFYVGNVEEIDVKKANFIAKVEFLPNFELKITTDNNALMLRSTMSSVINKINIYEIIKNANTGVAETINIYMNYSYLDMNIPSQPTTRNVSTKLVMSLKK